MKLKVDGLEFSYASTTILRDVCLTLAPSEVLGIVGPNGAGKSTLLRCINRILKPSGGSILLDEREIKDMARIEIARHLGYVPQTTSNVFPATVFDTVLMGRRPHIGWRTSERDVETVLEILKLLGIEEFALRNFNEISGGQQQKVVIARALAQEPHVLLLDEPTSNLDIRHQLEAMDIITKLVKEKEISAITAIHDLNLASRYVDKVIMLNGGSVFSVGDTHSVLNVENIKHVYGVEVAVKSEDGRPYIVPKRPIKPNGGESEV